MDKPTKQQIRARAKECASYIFTKIITLDPKVYETLIDQAEQYIFTAMTKDIELEFDSDK